MTTNRERHIQAASEALSAYQGVIGGVEPTALRGIGYALLALATPPPRPAVEIHRLSDEQIEVIFDGETIVSASHDEHGWSGMRVVEEVVTKLTQALGARVVEVFPPSGDDD